MNEELSLGFFFLLWMLQSRVFASAAWQSSNLLLVLRSLANNGQRPNKQDGMHRIKCILLSSQYSLRVAVAPSIPLLTGQAARFIAHWARFASALGMER